MRENIGKSAVIITFTCLFFLICILHRAEARVILIKHNCTSIKCTTSGGLVPEGAQKTVEGLKNEEIGSKYNEMEDHMSNNLKAEECTELLRLLYCKSMRILLGRNESFECDWKGRAHDAQRDDMTVKREADCKAYLKNWADAIEEGIQSGNQALQIYHMGLNHLKRTLKTKSDAIMTNLKRARKLLQQSNVNILVRGAIEPVELEREKMPLSHTNANEMRRPDFFTFMSRRIHRDKDNPTDPLLPWKQGAIPVMTLESISIPRKPIVPPKNPFFLRPVRRLDEMSELKLGSFENRQRVEGRFDDGGVSFQPYKFITLVAPVVFICSILMLLLWLCCNLRRFFGTRAPPKYSYNVKYSSVPENDGMYNAKMPKRPPVQGFLGNVDPNLMQHI